MVNKLRVALALAIASAFCFAIAFGTAKGWWHGTNEDEWEVAGLFFLALTAAAKLIP